MVVDIEASWQGPKEGGASCADHRHTPYHVTLGETDHLFDDEYGTCEFDPEQSSRSVWKGLPPSDEYYLNIWTNNANPHCCLVGNIEVSQSRNPTGESCTKMPDGPLTILHDALDVAGLIPVLGAIPDALNAGIYLIEGDFANAGLSGAAMIPIFGEGVTITKRGIKVTRAAIEKAGKEGIGEGLKKAAKEGAVAKEAAEKAAKEGSEKAAQEGGEKAVKEAEHAAQEKGARKPEKKAPEEQKKEKEKKEENKEKKTCATQFPSAINCSILYAFNFTSPQQALTVLKVTLGKPQLKLVSPTPSHSGPCPGVGMHYGVKDGKMYVASISCCPCCMDTPAGPRMATRCRIV